jgi:tetratricopeptide (TPR) repeat protein
MPGQAELAGLRADAEFSLQFDRGRRYLEEKRYAEAKSALESACRVRPSDVVAAGLLQQAQRMMQGQLRADFDQALSAGKTALVAARYVEAIAAFQQARRIFPNDQDAANLLSQAELGKKKTEFDQFIGQGKRALASARYVEAIGSFKEAQRILPDNREAANLIAEAERSKRKAEFDQFVSDGRRSLASGRYAEAIGSFKEAQRIFPNDKETAKLLADAENRKRRVDYDKAMAAGKGALSAHRILAATAAFKEAKLALPQDPEAARLLREAESLKRDYDTQIAKGRTALSSGKFDAALDAFRAATALVVDEPEAARLTRDAQNRKECAGLVNKGKLAMSQNRFADAVDAFTAAVRLVRGGEAQALLKQAEAKKKEDDRKNRRGK